MIYAPLDSSGAGRGEERAPQALEGAGLLDAAAVDSVADTGALIRDSRRDPETGVIGVGELRRASEAVAAAVSGALAAGRLPLVVGGDCSILLGICAALPDDAGLWFVDGHADFLDGATSPSGEAADMELGILTGHGPEGALIAGTPRLAPEAVTILGHRPADLSPDVALENSRIDPLIAALTAPEIRALGPARVGAEAAARFAGRPVWLHLDLDVLDADVLPAVSYPQAEGLDWEELIALTRPLAAAPTLLGISLADFNPDRDPGGTHAKRVVAGLTRILSARAAAE